MNRKKSCLALLAIAWLGGPATAAVPVPQGAFDEGAFHAGEARVEARLLLHPDAADPVRQRVGILFELDPGWHLYWRNPGASGLAPELEWQVEGDARVGAIEWPAPAPFLELEGEITTYGYADRVLLATDLSWDGAAPEHAKVRG